MYRGGYSYRVRLPAPVRSVEELKREFPTAEERLEEDRQRGSLVRKTLQQHALDRNLGEMVLHWKPLLEKARKYHRKLPRIPDAAKEALRAVGIKPPVRV